MFRFAIVLLTVIVLAGCSKHERTPAQTPAPDASRSGGSEIRESKAVYPEKEQSTPGAARPEAASSPHQQTVTETPATRPAPNASGPRPATASSPHQREVLQKPSPEEPPK